ncbi:MAG: UDP-glucose--hexose-1-phosphate uridylyltransferase [Eubacteriales bacterium]
MNKNKKTAAKYIEKLLAFGMQKQMMAHWDIPQIRNQLMSILKIDEPYYEKIENNSYNSPTDILKVLLDYAVAIGLINDTVTERDLLDAKLMGQLMPRQSEFINEFDKISRNEGQRAATDYFYQLSKHSNYIKTDRIAKNIKWLTETTYGTIEITINLSKPEKDPKEIEAAKNAANANYPKCLLCLENVGYEGRLNHPGRSNHRVMPVTLDDEQWYMQYSPYVYYNEHTIVFCEEHRPMVISEKTFDRLITFVDKFPHYFIGSNADLPIVGGSILSHDHFQGGHYIFPIEKAEVIKEFNHTKFKNVKIQMIKWPLSVIRLVSSNKDEIIELSDNILKAWRSYSDESIDIIDHTSDVPHNTITPIARKNQNGEYELDLTLRNNRTDEKHPEGIFHPHKHLHHIKKENIGLIEVMGLAVLPARLKYEINQITKILMGQIKEEQWIENEDLQKHLKWIKDLINQYGTSLNQEEASTIIKDSIGKKFKEVLECSGVFKQTKSGLNAFEKFIKKCL